MNKYCLRIFIILLFGFSFSCSRKKQGELRNIRMYEYHSGILRDSAYLIQQRINYTDSLYELMGYCENPVCQSFSEILIKGDTLYNQYGPLPNAVLPEDTFTYFLEAKRILIYYYKVSRFEPADGLHGIYYAPTLGVIAECGGRGLVRRYVFNSPGRLDEIMNDLCQVSPKLKIDLSYTQLDSAEYLSPWNLEVYDKDMVNALLSEWSYRLAYPNEGKPIYFNPAVMHKQYMFFKDKLGRKTAEIILFEWMDEQNPNSTIIVSTKNNGRYLRCRVYPETAAFEILEVIE